MVHLGRWRCLGKWLLVCRRHGMEFFLVELIKCFSLFQLLYICVLVKFSLLVVMLNWTEPSKYPNTKVTGSWYLTQPVGETAQLTRNSNISHYNRHFQKKTRHITWTKEFKLMLYTLTLRRHSIKSHIKALWVPVNSYPNQVVPCQLVPKPTRT